MITREQMDRAEKEFASEAMSADLKARTAERSLEATTYESPRVAKRYQEASKAFRDADYLAESRAWIVELIRKSRKGPAIPVTATCVFRDGDNWCAVFGDFVNIQESRAGFSPTFLGAIEALLKQVKSATRPLQNS